jgi:signal transduction histidine kinase
MDRTIRNHVVLSLVALLIALLCIGGWWATGDWPLLAVAGGGAFLALTFALGLGRDVSRRLRLLDTSLKKGERMRLLGQVSGGLAHQLRNGVASAKLAVQLHARSCDDGDSESLDAARRQLARVEADLNRFLDLGRDDVPRRPCHVVELVEEATALLRPQCRHADVQLCWEPPIGDPVVLGDPGRLGHIIVNLMSNAVDAAGPGGQVEVSVDQMGEGPCVVEIWDSGQGPDTTIAKRLFEPFVSGKTDGVGLGLFVAKQAAEAHGGRLDWRRERRRTCFRVELPAVQHVADDEPVAAASDSR